MCPKMVYTQNQPENQPEIPTVKGYPKVQNKFHRRVESLSLFK